MHGIYVLVNVNILSKSICTTTFVLVFKDSKFLLLLEIEVRDFLYVDVEHLNQPLDEDTRVDLRKQQYHLLQGYFVFFEDLLSYLVSMLNNEVVEAFLPL